MAGASTRLRQGIRALLAFAHTSDSSLAASVLSPQELALFRRMRRSEQLHSLNVLRTIMATTAASDEVPRDLAAAALLHDVGKIHYPLAIWQKTLAVLVRALLPDTAGRWSQAGPHSPFKRGLVVMAFHPAWGAELAAAAGASDRTVWLIAHHADAASAWREHPYYALLKRLQAADDMN